jgi:hypothetical protein
MKTRIMMLCVTVTLIATTNVAFGMQKSFTMPDGKTMFFNLPTTYVDPYTKAPIIATYIPKRRDASLLPVLALVKKKENPVEWELLTPDGLEIKLQSDPMKLNDANYLKNNIYFFVYDDKVSTNATFLCDGATVFKSAGNDTAQAYRNLVFGKYSPACTTKTSGCDLAKLDRMYKFAANEKTLLQPVDVMKKSTEVIQKNDGTMYTSLKTHLLKYSSLSSQPTLRDYDYTNPNDKLYATILYKNINGANAEVPLVLEHNLSASTGTKALVFLDSKGTMIGLVTYTPRVVNGKNVASLHQLVATPANKQALYHAFEEKMKDLMKSGSFPYIAIDTETEKTHPDDISLLKAVGFAETENNKKIFTKQIKSK